VGEVDLYSRENIEQFFKWKDDSALEHFPTELHCEEQASNYARSKPRVKGFITFKSKYRGKRYFWIEHGTAMELDPIECYLKVKEVRVERAKDIIYSKIFKRGVGK
jgi:hypothetical protein